MKTTLALAFLPLVVLGTGCAPADEEVGSSEDDVVASTSAYTSLDPADPEYSCTPVPGSETQTRCRGMHDSDLHFDKVGTGIIPSVISDGNRVVPLRLQDQDQTFFAAGEGRLGPKAEWRGKGVALGQVEPYAVILRYFVKDAKGTERSWMVVSRIEANNACIVGTVPGWEANHNAKAREIADASRQTTCPAPSCRILNAGSSIEAGARLSSCNGAFNLEMQTDGNLVMYDAASGAPKWASKTQGKGGRTVVMQEDGNLVIYGNKGAVWSTRSMTAGSWLEVTDQGSLEVWAPYEEGLRWTSAP